MNVPSPALNSLHLGPREAPQFWEEPDGGLRLSASQRSILDRVRASVAALGGPPSGLSEAEALRKIRVGARDTSGAGLVAFDASRVAVPEAGASPVALAQQWGHGGEASSSPSGGGTAEGATATSRIPPLWGWRAGPVSPRSR